MPDESLDLAAARERFEASTDFTVGIEEEFAILDPDSLDLVDRFAEMRDLAASDPPLADSVRGELIASEIEIRSGRGETFAEALNLQHDYRRRLFALAERIGVSLAATGTHPWADYRRQQIIDTPHYQQLKHDLRWVAQRNNTWSLHLHMGIRSADRAVAVCDRLRDSLPLLLAVSANSPLLDGLETGLHSARSQVFTRTFPRCGIHDPFGDWSTYANFVEMLERTGSIAESTELWWSVRPHHLFGTVEVRICDAQTGGEESDALAGLLAATIAQCALDYDNGRLLAPRPAREIEENLWRAIRYGMSGKLIDLDRGEEVEATAALQAHLEWIAPAAELIGVECSPPGPNGAQRAYERLRSGASIADVYREDVAWTLNTYAPEVVAK